MKAKQLQEIIQSKIISVPLYLYKEREQFKISSETFFFLMYLSSFGEKFKFNPTQIGQDLNMNLEKVMEEIENLTENGLLSVEVEKNKRGIMEEYVSLASFYNRAIRILIQEKQEEVDKSTIYEKIEKEFGRTLSPMEYEIIGAWIDSNMEEELINEALKEAVFNGVNNLRYIDKILYEWGKKGYKTKEDVEKQREKWRADKNQEKSVKKPKKEVFDYNWLEDSEDE